MTLQFNISIHNGESEYERNLELDAVQAALNVLRGRAVQGVSDFAAELQPYSGGPLTAAPTPSTLKDIVEKAEPVKASTDTKAAEVALLAEATAKGRRGRSPKPQPEAASPSTGAPEPGNTAPVEQPQVLESDEDMMAALLGQVMGNNTAEPVKQETSIDDDLAGLLGDVATTEVAPVAEDSLAALMGFDEPEMVPDQTPSGDGYESLDDAALWEKIKKLVENHGSPFVKHHLAIHKSAKTFRDTTREQRISILRSEDAEPFKG
jgi:hypothetical protein